MSLSLSLYMSIPPSSSHNIHPPLIPMYPPPSHHLILDVSISILSLIFLSSFWSYTPHDCSSYLTAQHYTYFRLPLYIALLPHFVLAVSLSMFLVLLNACTFSIASHRHTHALRLHWESTVNIDIRKKSNIKTLENGGHSSRWREHA